jgi:hypothetical protein
MTREEILQQEMDQLAVRGLDCAERITRIWFPGGRPDSLSLYIDHVDHCARPAVELQAVNKHWEEIFPKPAPAGWPWEQTLSGRGTKLKFERKNPKGRKECPLCLFYFLTGKPQPHINHRNGLCEWDTEPWPGKIKGPTIPKCPHGCYAPLEGISYCSVCGGIRDQAPVAAVETKKWDAVLKENVPDAVETRESVHCGLDIDGNVEELGGDEPVVQYEADEDWQARSSDVGSSAKAQSSSWFCKLRSIVSGEEVGDFQPRSIRRAKRTQKPPNWIMSNARLRRYVNFLLDPCTNFPRKKKADILMSLCSYYLYHRRGRTAADVGRELKITEEAAEKRIDGAGISGKEFFARLEWKRLMIDSGAVEAVPGINWAKLWAGKKDEVFLNLIDSKD